MKVTLIIVGGKRAGMEIPIPMPKCLIGRGDDCHIRPQSQLVSRRHCLISVDSGSAAIEDCGSANGTLVNGEKIQHRRNLNTSDRIKVGTLELEVRLVEDKVPNCAARRGPSPSPNGNGKAYRRAASAASVATGPAKSLAGQGNAKRQPTDNLRYTTARTVALAGSLDGEADILGWLDGKSNGRSAAQSLPESGVYKIAAGDLLNDSFAEPVIQQRQQNKGTTPCKAVARALPVSSIPASHKGAAAVSLETCREAKEWNGIDLLLMAAFGMALVVVLSWLFPMSWPEAGRGPRGWLRWFLWNWWHIWWLRWGTVAILVAALMKLLCIRAKSEQGG